MKTGTNTTAILDLLNIEPNESFKLDIRDDRIYRVTKDLELQYKDFNADKWLIENDFTVIDILTGLANIVASFEPVEQDFIAFQYGLQCGYRYLAMNKNRQINFFENKPQKNKSGNWSATTGRKNTCDMPISFLSPNDIEPYLITSTTYQAETPKKVPVSKSNIADVEEQLYYTFDMSKISGSPEDYKAAQKAAHPKSNLSRSTRGKH